MKTLCLICLIALLYLPARAQYCLANVTVVDVKRGKLIPGQYVYIKGQRIRAIKSQPLTYNSDTVYDCTGKYLMPGLWDMHIHDAGDDSSNRHEYVPLFLANGVTGIRDMWGSDEMLKLKADIDAGRFIGPRMIVGSPIVDGDKPIFKTALRASTPEQGRHYVDSLAAAGYDFIKIYTMIREPVYLAIADECQRKGIPLEGHLPMEIGLAEAVDEGQRSFEHNFNVNRYLTGKEAVYVKWSRHYLDTAHLPLKAEFMVENEPLGVSEKDFSLPPEVLHKMIKNRVAIVPTLTLAQGRSTSSDTMMKRTRGLEYLSAGFISYWTKQRPVLPPDLVQTFGAAAKFFMDQGVLVLAGTDVNNPFCVPGFGLRQELINLHNAGLNNLQVLQTATLNPAKFLYKEKDLGTVSAGKLADLLLLDDNPLNDIRNTQKINAVIVSGHYLSLQYLKQMLDAQRKR